MTFHRALPGHAFDRAISTTAHMTKELSRSHSALPVGLAAKPEDDVDHKALKELGAISLCDFLDQDPRPTLVLDLDSDHLDYGQAKQTIRPIFCNTALRLHDRLLDRVTGSSAKVDVGTLEQTSFSRFKSWATGVSEFDDSRDVFPQTFFYEGMLWTGSTTRQRWRLISGIQQPDPSRNPDVKLSVQDPRRDATLIAVAKKKLVEPTTVITKVTEPLLNHVASEIQPSLRSSTLASTTYDIPTFPENAKGRSSVPTTSGEASNDTSGSGSSIMLSSPANGVPDMTIAKPRGQLTEHMVFTRSVDWGATPLGPMESWSVQFREIVNLVMRNPHPAALFWGEELTMLYNEAYKNEVAGNKHPELMGTGFSGPFKEIWEGVGPIFRECARTGQSVRKENDYLPLERYGYLEETFFSWSFTPVYGGTKRSK